MRKIYCELHIFDLHQKVYIIDTATGNKECIAITTLEELPEVINAISDSEKVHKVLLAGNNVFSVTLSEDIVNYAKTHYSWNNIEVEVIK